MAEYFRMDVVDVFWITGRGAVITGTILEDTIKPGEEIVFGDTVYTVTGVESFAGRVKVGDNIGLLLRGGDKEVLSQHLGTEAFLHI